MFYSMAISAEDRTLGDFLLHARDAPAVGNHIAKRNLLDRRILVVELEASGMTLVAAGTAELLFTMPQPFSELLLPS